MAYLASTPQVEPSDNATVQLDFENEVQPDVLLRLVEDHGGASHVNEDGYFEGPPELIVEIAASSATYDMHDKRRVYAHTGVKEYVVVQMREQEIAWFALREGVYESIEPGDDGVLRSKIFPGLWLDPAAFWAGDMAGILQKLQEGLASEEHAEFLDGLAARD